MPNPWLISVSFLKPISLLFIWIFLITILILKNLKKLVKHWFLIKPFMDYILLETMGTNIIIYINLNLTYYFKLC
jgi:hypothetical protein